MRGIRICKLNIRICLTITTTSALLQKMLFYDIGINKQWNTSITEIPSISINFKNRCTLCEVYSINIVTIVLVDTFHSNKEDFPVACAVTSYKIRNHYIGWRLLRKQLENLSYKEISFFYRFPQHYINTLYTEHSFW